MSNRSTIREALTQGEPGQVASALKASGLGDAYERVDETIDFNTATNALLSDHALYVESVEVLTGAAAAGVRILGNTATTPAATICAVASEVTLAQLQTRITLEANADNVRIVYVKQGQPEKHILAQMVADSLTTPLAADMYVS